MKVPASEFATVVFVDLAGFSAITDVYGDRTAIAMLEVFEGMVGSALDGHAPPIKWIGDEVMLSFPNPQIAIRVLGRLLSACRNDSRLPLTRSALSHGQIIRRGNDLFGSTVNLAARIAALAAPGQVLTTQTVAEAASAEGILSEISGKQLSAHCPTRYLSMKSNLLRPRIKRGLTQFAKCMRHIPPSSAWLPLDRGFARNAARMHTFVRLRPTACLPSRRDPEKAPRRTILHHS